MSNTLKNNIVVKNAIEANKQLHKSQKQLLKLCRDQQYDIEERFEIWSELVEKIDHPYVFHFVQSKPGHAGDCSKWPLPKALLNWDEGCDQRYETYTWEEIYDCIGDIIAHEPETEEYDAEMKAIQEWFIQENFGSFKLDW